jgi:nicotinate-nucleotide adenylyltransferase
MKTAIFGGTFDPIHSAHLTVAREAADALGLERVLFVPAAHPPWKAASAPFEHRYKMVELACAADPRFQASRLEDRPGVNYTIDTVERLKSEHRGAIYFIIGADAFSDIEQWHRWKDLVREVEFIVVTRPGHGYSAPRGARVHRLDTLALPVSSSDIRQALARGETPADLPPEVAAYIRASGLYGRTIPAT